MELKISKNKIELDKKLNELDCFVLEFTSLLNKSNIEYAIVSGYVSILFGRNRASEDVDLIVKKYNFKKFDALWDKINDKFECVNSQDSRDAYDEYLLNGNAIRFSRKGMFIPNFEFKFPKNELDRWTTEYKTKVLLNKNKLYISPLELQIPFKIFLGGEKDIEDARYLYNLFKGKMDNELFEGFIHRLGVNKAFDKFLK